MRIEAIESFILNQYNIGKYRSFKMRCISSGIKAALVSVVLLVSSVLIYLNISGRRISEAVFLIVVAVLICPATIIFALRLCKRKLALDSKFYEETSASVIYEAKISKSHYLLGLGATLGFFVPRIVFPMLPKNVLAIVGFVVSIALATLVISISVSLFYKVYLIKKYCPYLRTIEDAKYMTSEEWTAFLADTKKRKKR